MPTFITQIRDQTGTVRSHRITAHSSREARKLLRNQGWVVYEIQPVRGFDWGALQKIDLIELFTPVSVKDKSIISRQLAVMVGTGITIVRSLGILAEQCTNPKLKKALATIRNDVQEGINLSDSMAKHPHCFDQLYISMVKAGEVGGVLDDVLGRLAKLLEDTARLQNQVQSALAYPLTVGFFAIAIFLGMTIFLIPTFAVIFEQIGVELPAFTLFMLGVSGALRNPLILGGILFCLILVAIAYSRYYQTPNGHLTIDGFWLKLPIIGDLIKKTATARLCRTLGSLIHSGVDILTALEIVRNTAGNQLIAKVINDSRRDVQGGGMISVSLSRSSVLPTMAVQMISVGEETGELDHMLMKVAEFYEDEVEQTVKSLTSLLEPVMIILIGLMVGSILLAMYLPMFKVFEQAN